jgi:hypothetical protein
MSITRDQAVDLCRWLNEKMTDVPAYTWTPDPGASEGGICATREDQSPVLRVTREGERVLLQFAPYSVNGTYSKLINLSSSVDFRGRGWVPKAVDHIRFYSKEKEKANAN